MAELYSLNESLLELLAEDVSRLNLEVVVSYRN